MANAEQALPRTFDLIVYGASGFTGGLVAEHLLGTYGATGEIRWRWPGEALGSWLRSVTYRRTVESAAHRRRRVQSSFAQSHGGKRQGDAPPLRTGHQHFHHPWFDPPKAWSEKGIS
jgi:hypothetical protein